MKATLLLLLLLIPTLGQAQNYHISAGVAEDLISKKATKEITALYLPNFGIRLSQFDAFPLQSYESEREGQLILGELEQGLTLPQFLWLIDYIHYEVARPMPFEFLTGYLGIGMVSGDMTYHGRSYQAQDNSLIQTGEATTVRGNLKSISFGLYGGESYLSMDLGLRYLFGDFELAGNRENFSKLQLNFILGFGY